MPAGVSWGQYMKFMASALLAMMAGSQAVHMYYKPLDDLPTYIENEQRAQRPEGLEAQGQPQPGQAQQPLAQQQPQLQQQQPQQQQSKETHQKRFSS